MIHVLMNPARFLSLSIRHDTSLMRLPPPSQFETCKNHLQIEQNKKEEQKSMQDTKFLKNSITDLSLLYYSYTWNT